MLNLFFLFRSFCGGDQASELVMCTGHGALTQLAPGDPFVFSIWFKGFGDLYPEAIEGVTIPRNAVPYADPRGRGCLLYTSAAADE